MLKKYRTQLIISSIIILLPIVAGLLMWHNLPGTMTIHWNMAGEADGISNKSFAIFIPTIILFLSHWLCVWVTTLDKSNKEQSSKVLGLVFWSMPLTSLLVNAVIYCMALEIEINIQMAVYILIAAMFLLIGNYLPKCKQNSTIGVRVPWTLKNEENWNKTHRFTGRLWVSGGLILLLAAFFNVDGLEYGFIPLILILSFVPMIYSYVYYRNQLKNGTADQNDVVMVQSHKKVTKVSMVIGVVAIAFAALLLFTGKFEIEFGDTSFTIDSVYWSDLIVNYEDIDRIEYRENDDPKAASSRTFGYGSFTLLMGEFKNQEFGRYTRYSHIACDSCVVITVDGKILVINGKDAAQTKALYDELLMKTEL